MGRGYYSHSIRPYGGIIMSWNNAQFCCNVGTTAAATPSSVVGITHQYEFENLLYLLIMSTLVINVADMWTMAK